MKNRVLIEDLTNIEIMYMKYISSKSTLQADNVCSEVCKSLVQGNQDLVTEFMKKHKIKTLMDLSHIIIDLDQRILSTKSYSELLKNK